MDNEIERYLAKPGLERLWRLVAQRIEQLGSTRGSVTLDKPDPAERRAVADLLGLKHELPGRDIRVSLSRLDTIFRQSRFSVGLAEAVTSVHGPLRNRPAERTQARQSWDETIGSFASDRRMADRPALQGWLDELVATGLLRRLGGENPSELLDRALDVLAALPLTKPELLPAFAARTAHDSHALDFGVPLATVVLRGVRALVVENEDSSISPEQASGTAAERRQLWEAVGVICDDLSCDVLVCNLTPTGPSQTERWLRDFAETGEPVRVTLRQVAGGNLKFQPGSRLYVVENPAIVSAASIALKAECPSILSLDGVPSTAARTVLGALTAAGGTIHYHGDFDWAGIRIANLLHDEYGFQLWRYKSEDYLEVASQSRLLPDLQGKAVNAKWDDRLMQSWASFGSVVQEEHVLDTLLADLENSQRRCSSSLNC